MLSGLRLFAIPIVLSFVSVTGTAIAQSEEESLRDALHNGYSMFAITTVDEKTDEKFRETTLEKFKKRLKDPYSVKFKDVEIRELSDDEFDNFRVLCGEYNAKNSYGAFTGYKPFVASGSVVKTISDIKTEWQAAGYRAMCRM